MKKDKTYFSNLFSRFFLLLSLSFLLGLVSSLFFIHIVTDDFNLYYDSPDDFGRKDIFYKKLAAQEKRDKKNG